MNKCGGICSTKQMYDNYEISSNPCECCSNGIIHTREEEWEEEFDREEMYNI